MKISTVLWKKIDNIYGWMGKEECEWIAETASAVTSWTEVGSYSGRSSLVVGLFIQSGGYIQFVDIQFQPQFFETMAYLVRERPDLQIVTYQSDGVKAAKYLQDTDVVFIDADHKYESVHADILSWYSKCKILCGHDYQPNWVGVVKAVDELCPGASNPVDAIWVR